MRVALCLHGLVGNIVGKSGDSNMGSDVVLKIAHQHWDRFFISPYNCDVFIHSWNVDLKSDMNKLFNPKNIITEEQRKFNIPEWIPGEPQRKQNHYSKWYSNQKSVELMSQYERDNKINYDLAIIGRFDIAWRKGIDLDSLNGKTFYIGGWMRNPANKIKDFWFISSPKNIRKFSTIFNYIEEYSSPKINAVSKSNGISNHKLVAHHLEVLGLKKEQLLKCEDDTDWEKSDYPLVRYYYYGAKK